MLNTCSKSTAAADKPPLWKQLNCCPITVPTNMAIKGPDAEVDKAVQHVPESARRSEDAGVRMSRNADKTSGKAIKHASAKTNENKNASGRMGRSMNASSRTSWKTNADADIRTSAKLSMNVSGNGGQKGGIRNQKGWQ